MAARKKLPYRTSITVRFVAPTDVKNKNPLDNSVDSATCTFSVYDHDKDEILSAAEAGGQATLSVTNPAAFLLADVAEVDLDDGTVHDGGAITDVDPVAGTIDVTNALPSGAAAGKRVRVRLGPVVTMTEFGTPKLGTRDWGFQATLTSVHPGLKIDVNVDIEVSFVGVAVGNTLDALDVICGVIKPLADCRET